MTSVIAPVWQEQYVVALRAGILPASAATMVGATLKQVAFWRSQSEEFDDICAQILEERVDALENKAYNLALNGTTKTIYDKFGSPIGEEQIEHKDLLMFMLKSSRDKFNDKLITQSKVDHNISISITSFAPSPESPREVIEGEYEHTDSSRPAVESTADHHHSHRSAVTSESPIEAYI